MSWWRFPPKTVEVQFDEKWAFVCKKRKHCNNDVLEDSRNGDNWDHVAYDPEHRLVVSVVPGKRTVKNIEKLVADFKKKTGGRVMNLMTSDEYKPYKKAILKAYGRKTTPVHTGKRGRPKGSRRIAAKGLIYATVHKTRRKGRVVSIDLRTVFGSKAQAAKLKWKLLQKPRRLAIRLTPLLWKGTTAPIATAMLGRFAEVTVFPKTGTFITQ